jgi:hypothetical protein
MKNLIAKIDYLQISTGCLIARLLIGAALSAPRPIKIVLASYAILVVANLILCLVKKGFRSWAKSKCKNQAIRAVLVAKAAHAKAF